MAVTFEQLKTKIGEWLGIDLEDDSERLPDSVRGDIVNIVMRSYLRKREHRFGEFNDNFNTIANSLAGYALPTGFSKPREFWYTDSGVIIPITYIRDTHVFNKKYPDTTKFGPPKHYAILFNKVFFGPPPDAIRDIQRQYYRLLPDLVDGAPNNENDFTKEAWEYLLFASLVKSTEFGVEDERLPIWIREMEKLELELDSEDARTKEIARVSQGTEPG